MSKESSIKVFAENASGTRPANAIPVWIDNISAIGGGGGGGNPEVESYVKTNSGKIDDVCSAVITNSASWSSTPNDTFYIYPGTTTDKEISENSGKYMKLYNSANNVFLDYAGKTTYSNYSFLTFKGVTGQGNSNIVQTLRLRVYPSATSACKVYDTTNVSLLDNNSTVSYANTAYYDSNGNDLTQTYSDLTALNDFVQSNSSNWGGGSSTGSDDVLFHSYTYQPSDGGMASKNSYISGASELYFEARVDSNYGTPNNLEIKQGGGYAGDAYWMLVSSDGPYNYYTASYNGMSNGDFELDNKGFNSYDYCYVSANGVRTEAFNQGQYKCSTDKTIKCNVQGSNITGTINGVNHGMNTPLTSFTGSLTDFTAKGYEQYNFDVFSEDYYSDMSYNISAEFSEGSTVASGDVFPPTNNLDPYSTYYLGWNANNGGLFWYQAGNGN